MKKTSTRIAAAAATLLILASTASPAMAAKKTTAPAPKPATTCTIENGCLLPYPGEDRTV